MHRLVWSQYVFARVFIVLACQIGTAAQHLLTCIYRHSGPCGCGARVLSHKRCTHRAQRLQIKVAALLAWHISTPLSVWIPTPNCIACKAVLQFHHCLLCSVYLIQVYLQVQATAEVLSRPDTHIHADRFNFKGYMASRAELVNEALEASVPLQYPEDVVESMRSGSCIYLITPSACRSELLQHSSLIYNSTKHSLYTLLPCCVATKAPQAIRTA